VIEDDLRRWSEAGGRPFAVAGVEVLDTVRRMLEERRDTGQIDGAFFRENLSGFGFGEGSGVAKPEAVLLLSVRSPAHVVSFELDGRVFEGLLPPTYYRYNAVFMDVLAELKKVLGEGASVGLLKAPLKSVSVHMGLAVYGRNNVTYVPGFGSHHQLCGYLVGGDPGRRLREAFARPGQAVETALERCAGCRACVNACPMGAIREDRFLLSAERCNVRFTETRGAKPDGIQQAGPACLVGCLACLEACPENKGKLRYEKLDTAFTEPETRALLELGRLEYAGKGNEGGTPPPGAAPALWAAVTEKFDRLHITEEIEAFARNVLLLSEAL
jgi:epoxyqueuosine reductase